MDARIITAGDEQFTAERCFIAELLTGSIDPQTSIARARVAPGIATQRHALRGVTERYVIVAGSGRVEVGDAAPVEVGPWAVVCIPSGVAQRIVNTGSTDLVFLCVCTPAFTPACYVNLEYLGREFS